MERTIEEKHREVTQYKIDMAWRASQAIANQVADFNMAFNGPDFKDTYSEFKLLSYAGDIAELADQFAGRGWRKGESPCHANGFYTQSFTARAVGVMRAGIGRLWLIATRRPATMPPRSSGKVTNA